MTFRILHLSDTHCTGTGFDQSGVNAVAALEGILYDARHLDGLDLVVVTGDISDDGSAAGYKAVRERIGAFAAARGIPHVYSTGNHDDRSAFAATLGSGHLGPDGANIGKLAVEAGLERAAVSQINGLRVITLDSLVPGDLHGLISTDQLEWLADLLATHSPLGTVIAMHHPPIAIGWTEVTARAGLQNRDELAKVVSGSDVRAILCGHFHAQLTGRLAGITVTVTPGIVTRLDFTVPPHLVRAVKGAGGSVIDIGGPFELSIHSFQARDPEAGNEVYVVDFDSREPATTE